MMKKTLATILSVLMLAVLTAFITPASPAAAVSGCSSQVILKGDSWSEEVTYLAYDINPLPTYKKIRLTATAAYWFCPNGASYDKIKVKWVEFCYSHIDGTWGLNFDGAKFDGYFASSTEAVNPGQVKVDDDNTVQNCYQQDIPEASELWFRMGHAPGWSVTSWVVLVGFPDQEKTFKSNGLTKKYFNPAGDVNLGDWHWRGQ